jgi:CRISPR-associated protein Cas1
MTSLYIDRRGTEIELESEAIVFRENGERIGTVPIAPLTRVFIRGDVRLSAALLGKLGEHDIGVVVLSGRQGNPSLLLARPHNDAARRVTQIKMSLDADACLTLAQTLVERKLATQTQWFDEMRQSDRQARYDLSHAIKLIDGLREKLPSAENLAQLRGLEGSAAACYFDGLKAALPESLNFTGRNRRPPRDPFNALISLSYTLVHAELAIALYGAGFDPYVGFYHQLDFGRESLACDLLEPLRPLADRFAFGLFRKQILNKDHFSVTEGGCLLGKAGRAHFYAAYEGEKEILRHGIRQEIEWLSERLGLEKPGAVETAPTPLMAAA